MINEDFVHNIYYKKIIKKKIKNIFKKHIYIFNILIIISTILFLFYENKNKHTKKISFKTDKCINNQQKKNKISQKNFEPFKEKWKYIETLTTKTKKIISP